MDDAKKLVSKCVYVNICLSTSSTDILEKYVHFISISIFFQCFQIAYLALILR